MSYTNVHTRGTSTQVYSFCYRLLGDRDVAVAYEISHNETYLNNKTLLYNISTNEDYIFDRTDVKVIFITLYTIVFVCCFFGVCAIYIHNIFTIYCFAQREKYAIERELCVYVFLTRKFSHLTFGEKIDLYITGIII